ncbi:hypothetical protein TNCV_3995401 [Trichonephila clavipes]|nr:hypothetical protein TNCV_3995401 [Trichonephila clavipes]
MSSSADFRKTKYVSHWLRNVHRCPPPRSHPSSPSVKLVKRRWVVWDVLFLLNLQTQNLMSITCFVSPRVAAVAEWYRYRSVACLVTNSSPVPLKTLRVGQRRSNLICRELKRPPIGGVW